MGKQVGFGYGCLCEPLEKQANDQGFTLGEKAEHFEGVRKAIYTLMFGGYLTDSQLDKVFQKLNKRVVESLKPLGEVIDDDG